MLPGIYEVQLQIDTSLPTNPLTQMYIAQNVFTSNIVTIPVVARVSPAANQCAPGPAATTGQTTRGAAQPFVRASRPFCVVEHDPVFSQQFIDHHAAGGGHIERMFAAQHGNAHVGIAQSQQRCGQAIHFVPEQHAHREARLPIIQVGGMNAGFHCGDFVALLAEMRESAAAGSA